jgi:hypothetical protein
LIDVWRPGNAVQSIETESGIGIVERIGMSPDGRILVGSSQWGIWAHDLAHGTSAVTPISIGKDGAQFYSAQQVGTPLWPNGGGQSITIVSADPFRSNHLTLTQWNASGRKISEVVIASAPDNADGRHYRLADVETAANGRMFASVWEGVKVRMEGGQPVEESTWESIVELRDTRTGRVLRDLQTSASHRSWALPSFMGRPAFSADGTRVAIADGTGIIRLWDTSTGRQIGQMSGALGARTDTVRDDFGESAILAFSPDGRFLAAGRNDGSIYLYSLRTFLPVAQIGEVSSGDTHIPNKPSWMAYDAIGHTLYCVVANRSDVLALDVPQVSP